MKLTKFYTFLKTGTSLPARGVWIEIEIMGGISRGASGHSPQGECGLKSLPSDKSLRQQKSLPARGVWIEIAGSAGDGVSDGSLPARGVWIEIDKCCYYLKEKPVTPRKGSVD